MNDMYSKVMLTIIAAALSINALQGLDLVKPAYAASGVTKVAICDDSGRNCAKVKKGLLYVAAIN